MKIQEAEKQLETLRERAERDNDAVLVCYFSREQEAYNGYMTNMDAGDALIVIEQLIRKFNLSPEVIAATSQATGDLIRGGH